MCTTSPATWGCGTTMWSSPSTASRLSSPRATTTSQRVRGLLSRGRPMGWSRQRSHGWRGPARQGCRRSGRGRMDALPAIRLDAADDRRPMSIHRCHPWFPNDPAQEERRGVGVAEKRGGPSPMPPWPGCGTRCRPGVREFELAAAIESSYLGVGGLTTFYYIASTPMSSPERCVPAQVLSNREIQAGDVVTCEISVSYAGYAGQGLRTFTVGEEPIPSDRRAACGGRGGVPRRRREPSGQVPGSKRYGSASEASRTEGSPSGTASCTDMASVSCPRRSAPGRPPMVSTTTGYSSPAKRW